MNTPPALPPLDTKTGALQSIEAARLVSDPVNIQSNGQAEHYAAAHLARDLGAALLATSMEHGGTLEFHLTVTKTPQKDEQHGAVTEHKWRVDVWRARQRQWVQVPVRELGLLEIEKPDATSQSFATENGRLGYCVCPHCGQQHQMPPLVTERLPRRITRRCHRCTLPMHLLLVKAQ